MYLEEYKRWLAADLEDADLNPELARIEGNDEEIKDRFAVSLKFGTAGLRGVLGAGTNRMNVYTVRKATQGLANYIIKQNGQKKGVAIAFDSRRMSPEFADEAACCLAANGIKAYVFESLRPTPELSFAVRELGCISGINITASHNPPEYNGYKVYWEDGAQITPPHDTGIMDEVKAVTDYAAVKTMDKEEAKKAGLYENIGKAVDDRYMEELKKNVLHPDCIKKASADLKIVYTPLHGTGNIPVRRVLKELGFRNVYVVPEQELPDGDFPTVSYPNPEAAEAFELALALAKEKNADLVLHLIGQLEQKFEKSRFVRVDSDTIDNLIRKEDSSKVTLSEEQKTAMQEVFKSQMPKLNKTEFYVTFEALGENANPVMLTQSEYMRRMREMSAMQPGMSFYGEMPDSFNFVLNTDHPLIKKVLTEEEQACDEKLKPILSDIKGWEARQADLREAQSKKKEDEITAQEKEDMTNTDHKLDELREQRNQVLAEYAGTNKTVSQLIDLALLGNGMLKGEALSQFIKRSVELIG